MKSITIKRVQVVENNLINKNKFIFRVIPKAKTTKPKINKWNYTKLKIRTAKETIKNKK